MRDDMPNLRGRWFNVALCCDCWDRCHPERAMGDERKRDLEDETIRQFAGLDKGDIATNRCAGCDEVPHAGIWVRVTVESLRALRVR